MQISVLECIIVGTLQLGTCNFSFKKRIPLQTGLNLIDFTIVIVLQMKCLKSQRYESHCLKILNQSPTIITTLYLTTPSPPPESVELTSFDCINLRRKKKILTFGSPFTTVVNLILFLLSSEVPSSGFCKERKSMHKQSYIYKYTKVFNKPFNTFLFKRCVIFVTGLLAVLVSAFSLRGDEI